MVYIVTDINTDIDIDTPERMIEYAPIFPFYWEYWEGFFLLWSRCWFVETH